MYENRIFDYIIIVIVNGRMNGVYVPWVLVVCNFLIFILQLLRVVVSPRRKKKSLHVHPRLSLAFSTGSVVGARF